MRGKILWGLVGVLLLITAGNASPAAGQTHQRYRFAYLEVGESLVSLFAIDPSIPANAIPLYQINVPDRFSFQEAHTSPEGRYILLVYQSVSHQGALYILDLKMEKYLFLFESNHPLDEIRWSPDGTYFTFREREGAHIRYMAIPGWHAVNALPHPLQTFTDALFSPDGLHLAGVVGRPAERGIEYALSVFEVRSWQVVTSPPVIAFSPFQTDPLCDLTWSPDGTWIAFNAPCDDSRPTELYLMNTSSGHVRRLTHNRADLSAVTDPLRYVTRQALVWQSHTRLLVGQLLIAEPRPDPDPLNALVIHRTRAYDVTVDNPEPIILFEHIALEWSKQPVGDLLAYRLRETTTEGSPLGEAVIVAKETGAGLLEQARYLAGCDWLQWSPDGQWLAYRELSQYCWEQPFLTLINAHTLEASQHQVGVVDMKTIYWLGWLKVE